jgi:mono/diheme cytochrome c family protein
MYRLLWFVLGVVIAIAALFVGGYLFLVSGGVSMETTASPLPLERTVARLALRSSYGTTRDQRNPVAADERNLLVAADVYRRECAVCHGVPGGSRSAIARGMFPDPPQLFEHTVTDDPEGMTFWKVTHGIRLSGMPGFGKTLSETERWQVTSLLAHADKLPQVVQAALTRPTP